ncbi:hypothetical protein D3C72_2481510 [compost metagenome]
MKELAEMSFASTRLARTLPVMKVSLERWLSVVVGMTARSLTTERVFSTCETICSTVCRSWAVATSPVSRAWRL